MGISVEQCPAQIAGQRHVCFGFKGPAYGPRRLVSPEGCSELPGWVQWRHRCGWQLRPEASAPGSPGRVAGEARRKKVSPLRPLSWTWDGVSGRKDRLAGLGPELQHGMVLSPQPSGAHSPAWSQATFQGALPGLSGTWLAGEPHGGLGKEKAPSPHVSIIRLVTGRCSCCLWCLVFTQEP